MTRPISAAYLERKLRSIAGVQGDNPLPDLEDLAGLLALEVDRPEWKLAGDERLRSAFSFVGGVATQLTVIGIDNTINSGLIAIVERISAWAPGGSSNRHVVAWLNSGFLTNQATQVRDGRETVLSLPISAVGWGFSNQTPATFLANGLVDIDEFATQGGGAGGEGYRDPIIVPPGRALVVYEVDTLNARVLGTALTASMAWRTRPLEGRFDIR